MRTYIEICFNENKKKKKKKKENVFTRRNGHGDSSVLELEGVWHVKRRVGKEVTAKIKIVVFQYV